MQKITTIVISVCFALSVSADEIVHKPNLRSVGKTVGGEYVL